MADDVRSLKLEVHLEGDKLVLSQLKSIETAGDTTAKKAQLASISLSAGYLAVADALGKVYNFGLKVWEIVNDLALGGDKLNTSQIALSVSMERYGTYSASAMAHLRDWASEMQALTKATIPETMQAFAQAEEASGLYAGGLDRMGKVAIGLMEIYGDDFPTAMEKTWKAVDGSAKILKQFGIIADAHWSKEQRLQKMEQATADAYDVVAAKAKTVTAQTELMHARLQDLHDVQGLVLTKSGDLADAMSGFNDVLAGTTAEIQKLLDESPGLMDMLGKMAALSFLSGGQTRLTWETTKMWVGAELGKFGPSLVAAGAKKGSPEYEAAMNELTALTVLQGGVVGANRNAQQQLKQMKEDLIKQLTWPTPIQAGASMPLGGGGKKYTPFSGQAVDKQRGIKLPPEFNWGIFDALIRETAKRGGPSWSDEDYLQTLLARWSATGIGYTPETWPGSYAAGTGETYRSGPRGMMPVTGDWYRQRRAQARGDMRLNVGRFGMMDWQRGAFGHDETAQLIEMLLGGGGLGQVGTAAGQISGGALGKSLGLRGVPGLLAGSVGGMAGGFLLGGLERTLRGLFKKHHRDGSTPAQAIFVDAPKLEDKLDQMLNISKVAILQGAGRGYTAMMSNAALQAERAGVH